VRQLAGPAVLVPVKAFGQAKVRLAPALSPSARRRLARAMATHVVRSAGRLPAFVVCDDPEVAEWAEGAGAGVLWEPGRGLNLAVAAGVRQLEELGASAIVVAAGDLPLADDLAWVADFEGLTLVPDRHRDGTNVIGLPTGAGFTFSYGPGSFDRHVAAGRATGLATRVVTSDRLAWDIDHPEDLAALPR
jgi:2-phospho-L-lactate guanylyltransferase